jgi:hypothetical protein
VVTADIIQPADTEIVTHIATTWEIISKKENRTDILHKAFRDENNLIHFEKSLDVVDDGSIFVRATIHYYDVINGVEVVTEPTPFINFNKHGVGYKSSNDIVYTPKVHLVGIENNSGLKQLTFKTSEFTMFSGDDVHFATSWVIKDMSNNEIWSRMLDEDNLLNITIPEPKLTLHKSYYMEVTHHAKNGTSSIPGKKYFTTDTVRLDKDQWLK